jgi:hypothetical protein
MNNEQQKDIKNSVLSRIESGEIKMKPKTFFVLKVVSLSFIIVATSLISILLISYILFSIRVGGHILLLGFGVKGLYKFLLIFPWLLLILDIALLLFLDFLLKRFKFGYHSPIINLFLATFVVITAFGSIVSFSRIHTTFLNKAEHNQLPSPFLGFYSGVRKSHAEEGIFRGLVASESTSTFIIIHNDYDDGPGDQITVIEPNGADIRQFIAKGDEVFIAGEMINGQIYAYGIRKIPDEIESF